MRTQLSIPVHCASCAPGSYQNQTGQASCIDCAAGFYSGEGMPQCNRCKPEEYSLTNGSDCISCLDAVECPCLTNGTCFSRSNCFNTGGGNHYCGACPWGYQGDGITCTDIDEVINTRKIIFSKPCHAYILYTTPS